MSPRKKTKISAITLSRQIARGELSVREVVAQALGKINDDKHNAWITVAADQALKQADAVQERLRQGDHSLSMLAGLPLAVKDNISTAEIRTTCASRMLADYTPVFDATVIRKMKKAGLIVIGKTNMDEFAMGSTNETSWFGPVRNPWNPDFVPGGSSGGSAAAVSSGQVQLALGTDTGGSLRQPCTWCGLTGLRPTYGTVSRYGLVAYASSLDQIGPMAHDARDCAALFDLLRGPDKRDATMSTVAHEKKSVKTTFTQLAAGDFRGLKIGMPENDQTEPLDDDVKCAVLQVGRTMTKMGAQLGSYRVNLLEEAVAAYYLIASAEASSNLARYDGIRYGFREEATEPSSAEEDLYTRTRTKGFGMEVQRRILLGTFALSEGYYADWYLKAQQVRQQVKSHLLRIFNTFDFLIMPVTPTAAFRLGSSLQDPFALYRSDRYAIPASLAGLPAVSLPCGFNSQGLPVGVQLIGQRFSDPMLLQVAQGYQEVTSFHQETANTDLNHGEQHDV